MFLQTLVVYKVCWAVLYRWRAWPAAREHGTLLHTWLCPFAHAVITIFCCQGRWFLLHPPCYGFERHLAKRSAPYYMVSWDYTGLLFVREISVSTDGKTILRPGLHGSSARVRTTGLRTR
jgi:hypothetical protein